ncbi:hypothetical protein [Bacteroides fluxus]|uniref:hypothetical protein n=1 Tax=Bacteroides fluxus TaxID=626930 RepID=UPI0023A80354|nr:hypothetical protein [Bacteroides fluxus]
MEPQKTKIALYVKRSFGEKLGASFDFIKEHWKLLLKFSTYLLLPLCLVQALSLNGLTQGILAWGDAAGGASGYNEAALPLGLMSYYGLYLLLYMVGTVLLTSLVYAVVRAYQERDGCLEGMTLGVLKPLLLRNVRQLVLVILLGILLLVFAGLALGFISKLFSSSVLLLVLCFMVLALPLALWAPVCLFEDISVADALVKSYRLGLATWGGILSMMIVMGLVAAILQGVTMLPWYIGLAIKTIFTAAESGSAAVNSAGYDFVLYLLAIVQGFGTYLAMIFTLVGLAYQYGHASEKLDNVTVESDIDNFDKL